MIHTYRNITGATQYILNGKYKVEANQTIDLDERYVSGVSSSILQDQGEATSQTPYWIPLTKEVSVPGTPEPLSETPISASKIWIQAKEDNEGNVYVGCSNISNNAPGLQAGTHIVMDILDVSDIYLDADNAGDGVKAEYCTLDLTE